MSSEYSDLQRRMNGLADDIHGLDLPGPQAARLRGRQRARRHAAGAVTGVVLALTGGTLAVAQLSGPADFQPAGPPTDSTVEPTRDLTDAALPGNALMTADDIVDDRYPPSISAYEWTAADDDRPECFPAIGIEALSQRGQTTYSAGNTPADFASHDVYLIEPGIGPEVFELLVGQVADCAQATELAGPLVNIGDQGYLIQYMYPGDGTFIWLVEYSVVRTGDLISVVTRWLGAQDYPGEPDIGTPANAAERMCDAVFGATCVSGAPSFAPEPSGDDPVGELDAGSYEIADRPFLTEDQVNPVGARERFIQRELSEGVNAPPWDVLCMDDPASLDAVQEIRSEPWTDTFDASLYQTVLSFTDAEDADQWLRGYTAIEDRCAAFDVESAFGSVTDHQTLDLPSGDEALAWSLFYTPPEAGTGFWGAATARRGNIVFILTYGAMDGPDGPGDWSGYATERLGPALDNAVGVQP